MSISAGRQATGLAPCPSVIPGPDISEGIYVVCREGKVVELGFGRPGPVTSPDSGPDAALARDVVAQVSGALEVGRAPPEFPVEQAGTAFDTMVWSAIRGIPFGETVSYSELASAVGRPGSQRAVAGACGRNRAALLVPCHRVIAADGSPGGYRWGIRRKQALLEFEAGSRSA